jgi:hypothetical protein
VSRRRAAAQGGAATVDFVMVGALVTMLFLAILQLGIDLYVRNVLAACLADGARYGANADIASPAAGAARSNLEISGALGGHYATAYSLPLVDVDGAPAVEVAASVRLPLIAWFLPVGPTVHATGQALLEPG